MSNNNQPQPWSEAPPWAQWRAQDEDGSWFFYKEKPICANNMWSNDHILDESNCLLFQWGVANPNWQDTLQKRPENE